MLRWQRGGFAAAAKRWPWVVGASALLGGLAAVGTLNVLAGPAVNAAVLYLPGIDKLLHCAAFLVLFFVAHRVAVAVPSGPWRRPLLLTAPLLLFAAADEIGQQFASSRNLELADFLANVCGIALGASWVQRRESRWVATATALAAVLLVGTLTSSSYLRLRHFNRGLRYARDGDHAAARRQYLLAIQDGLDSPGLYNELGWTEIESGEGQPQKAVEYASKALAMRPENPDVLDTYGWALHNAGRSADALVPLERAYGLKPDMFCIHYHLGEVYAALGRFGEARHHLQEQVAAFPHTSEARRAQRVLSRLAAPGAPRCSTEGR